VDPPDMVYPRRSLKKQTRNKKDEY
jgi:hypothetical protein